MIRYDRRPGRLLTPHARQSLSRAALVAAGVVALAVLFNAAATAHKLGRFPWN